MLQKKPGSRVGDLDTATILRGSMLALAATGVVATALELATLRHWTTTTQLIPWMVLGLVAVGVATLIVHPSRRSIRVVRLIACFAVASGLYGLFVHVKSNYEAAILDYRFTDSWPAMSLVAKLWAAGTGKVGPSPVIAPAVLSQCAISLALATLRHPRLVPAGALNRLLEIKPTMQHDAMPVGS